MILLDLIRWARERLDDTGGDTGEPTPPYRYRWEEDDGNCLWTNQELTQYAEAAGRELARRVPIVDSEPSEVTQISVRPGVRAYLLDDRILAVDAVVSSAGTPLQKWSDAQARNKALDHDLRFDQLAPATTYREDVTTRQMMVYATPILADTLTLTVRRFPLEPMDWSQRTSQEIEFAPSLHEALLHWICHLAYLKRDSDTANVELAGYYQGQFSDQVGPRISYQASQVQKDIAGLRLRTRAQY